MRYAYSSSRQRTDSSQGERGNAQRTALLLVIALALSIALIACGRPLDQPPRLCPTPPRLKLNPSTQRNPAAHRDRDTSALTHTYPTAADCHLNSRPHADADSY